MSTFVPELIEINVRKNIKIQKEQKENSNNIVYTVYKRKLFGWRPLYTNVNLEKVKEYYFFELLNDNFYNRDKENHD